LTPESAARLRSQWGKLWDTKRKVLLEKSPPDLIRMRFLAAVFPPSWFVVILRHPLSVCRRVEWHMRLLCTHNWLNAYEWAHEDIRDGNLTAYVSYYEHWVTHPVQELSAMTPLLGLAHEDFDWSTVIKEKADMNLKSHATAGCARCQRVPTHVPFVGLDVPNGQPIATALDVILPLNSLSCVADATAARAGGDTAGRSRALAFRM